MNENAPDPSLERSFASEFAYILIHLDKTFLHHIIRIFGIFGISEANAIHF
jgi:hypothetical protein